MSLFDELGRFCVRDFAKEDEDKSREKKPIIMGPWGAEEGDDWSFNEEGDAIIKQVKVYSGEVIHSLTFEYELDGEDDHAKFGGDDGTLQGEFNLNFPAEYLTGISGTFRRWLRGTTVISSLKFVTNLKEYGPFGQEGEGSFQFEQGGMILGFHGRMDEYIHAIGVYVKPA